MLNGVSSNPALFSSLLNRQLPQQILKETNRLKIRLFPASWRAVCGHCSCPDWALPCKHLAGAIYLFANETYKNSSIVFELHGRDLSG